MSGPVPESFFGLTNLLVLGMDDNLFESPIEPFAKLTKLQKLYAEGTLRYVCACDCNDHDRCRSLSTDSGFLFFNLSGNAFYLFYF